LPLQKQAEIIHHPAVGGLIHSANTWTTAQLDVIVQAGARVRPGDLPVAGQVGENPAQYIQGLVHRPDGGVRSKIAGTVIHHLAGDGDFGEGIRPMHLDVRIPLIILEPDIEPRTVLLDQVHFKD